MGQCLILGRDNIFKIVNVDERKNFVLNTHKVSQLIYFIFNKREVVDGRGIKVKD
jgi:hypothetical protein